MNEVVSGEERAAADAIKAYKQKRGIKPKEEREAAPFRNRYGQETYYPEALHPDRIESQLPSTRPGAKACGNLRSYKGDMYCQGCGKIEGMCEWTFRGMVNRRRRDMAGEGMFSAKMINLEEKATWTLDKPFNHRHVFRASKPIVMEHADSRPIVCETEYQVEQELKRIDKRSVRGPGQDA